MVRGLRPASLGGRNCEIHSELRTSHTRTCSGVRVRVRVGVGVRVRVKVGVRVRVRVVGVRFRLVQGGSG